ncbi:hypothetical protein BC03BB108_C0081 (plasmid) [Bacillus cereus 03BB108]|nr:hypothetical protein BC03BB108_C0081 [Bacillus cereus 03BB108]
MGILNGYRDQKLGLEQFDNFSNFYKSIQSMKNNYSLF